MGGDFAMLFFSLRVLHIFCEVTGTHGMLFLGESVVVVGIAELCRNAVPFEM